MFTRDGKSSDAVDFAWQKGNGETFMEWVSKLVKDEFNIGNKDNWNPADIWLIPLFRSKQIMGISLKKIGKGPATWKEVNVSGTYFRKLEATHMKLKSATCKLGTVKISDKAAEDAIRRGKKNPRTGLVGRGKAGAATLTQDTVLTIEDPGIGPSGKKTTYTVQIKANDSTKFSNLKWEPTIKDKGAARLGKATVELVLDLMKVYNMMDTYEPNNKMFPDDKTGFDIVMPMYRDMIDEMLQDGFVNFGPNIDTTTAIINIREAFDIYRGQPWVAASKLQQICFLYALVSLPNTKGRTRDDFCTSLIFTAEKSGRRYGPYGKLY